MAKDGDAGGLEQELSQAIDELHEALRRADRAAETLRALTPRLAAAGGVLEEIEALVQAGRSQIGGQQRQPTQYTRPTLVVPGGEARPTPVLDPVTPEQPEAEEQRPVWPSQPEQEPGPTTEAAEVAPWTDTLTEQQESQIAFRLSFESTPGPLDLRAVDEAVSEHPAVRDVALLDYDGRRATLKVWIAGGTSPSDVQESLRQRSGERFGQGQQVTIVALEDAA